MQKSSFIFLLLIILLSTISLSNLSNAVTLTLNGNNPDFVVLGKNYNDPATATSTGTVSLSTSSTLATNTLGRHTIIYTATAGSESETATRIIYVVSANKLDIDNNGKVRANSDGLIIRNYIAGLSGEALIKNLLAKDAVIASATDVLAYLDFIGGTKTFDINADGQTEKTEADIILRYLFGVRGQLFVGGVADANKIKLAYLNDGLPERIETTPEAPEIISSENGFNITWEQVSNADYYRLYRNNKEIYATNTFLFAYQESGTVAGNEYRIRSCKNDRLSTCSVASSLGILDGKRTPDEEFTLSATNTEPRGLWSDEETLWVANNNLDKVFAYNLRSGSRTSSKDFNTLVDVDNLSPGGLWSDGKTLWVVNEGSGFIFAYNSANQTRDEDEEFNLTNISGGKNQNPAGIWSDKETLWVADRDEQTILAYNLASKTREPNKNFNLDASNTARNGMWSDGRTMWVGDSGKKKIFAYQIITELPVKPNVPSILNTFVESGSQINLFWQSDASATFYRLYRDDVQIYTSNTSNYEDSGLEGSTTYHYTLRACGNSHIASCSAHSQVINAITTAAKN